MSALLRIFFVATLICVNPRVRKRGFSVKALQALEACTRSQREIFFPDAAAPFCFSYGASKLSASCLDSAHACDSPVSFGPLQLFPKLPQVFRPPALRPGSAPLLLGKLVEGGCHCLPECYPCRVCLVRCGRICEHRSLSCSPLEILLCLCPLFLCRLPVSSVVCWLISTVYRIIRRMVFLVVSAVLAPNKRALARLWLARRKYFNVTGLNFRARERVS